jgi:hypothetical protein
VTRLAARVVRLENYNTGGAAVARIVGMIERADDEELDRLNQSGELARMARRLGNRQLDRLIHELQQMLIKAKGDPDNGSMQELC